MPIRVKLLQNYKGSKIPQRATSGSSGFDLVSSVDFPVYLKPSSVTTIRCGVAFEIPEGYEGQIRPRSGLASKHGILCVVGTIDSDYTGEINSILFNLSSETYVIQPGERISQIVFQKIPQIEIVEVSEILKDTQRSDGGFGHTGKF